MYDRLYSRVGCRLSPPCMMDPTPRDRYEGYEPVGSGVA